MPQNFEPGDFLIFQLESGYGLLRFIARTERSDEPVWHVAAYDDLFMDVDSAESAITAGSKLLIGHPHIALTSRAFDSTQVAKIANLPLSDLELMKLSEWEKDPRAEVSDRSVRLMLGFR